jgi:hypothetical protein
VLCAGRHLERAGFPLLLYRRRGRPLPAGVDGPWDWPPHHRRSSLAPRAPRAVTVAPAWGITAAPARAEPLGRAGPWAEETAAIERAYGPERTVHVSLEEFGRTLTSASESRERLREGGVRAREIPACLDRARRNGEVAAYHDAFRKFRGFDRPNLLHLFATFTYARPFAKEFPEAVQTGPLWSGRGAQRAASRPPARWVWYASPASAEAFAPAVAEGLRAAGASLAVHVRSPRPWTRAGALQGITVRAEAWPSATWLREFREATLRIVTGSRSFLEALEAGGPFLYFNGVLGAGVARRRHRPEKIAGFLALARRSGWPPDLLTDLADFAKGRRVAEVVARAARGIGSWSRFPRAPRPVGFAPGFEDAGTTLVRAVRKFAAGALPASRLVAETRRASHR